MGQMVHHCQMSESWPSWPSHHFSLGNPRDDGADDLPKLLRRIADAIEDLKLDPMNILDLTISQVINENGPWWSASLYWSSEDEPAATGEPGADEGAT